MVPLALDALIGPLSNSMTVIEISTQLDYIESKGTIGSQFLGKNRWVNL
jgi:hypothetical protein